MNNPSNFRTWLKQRRQERGLTQEELGELVGYSAQTITKIEGGRRHPSLQLARRLAEALQLPPDERAAWMASALADNEAEASVAQASEAAPPRQPATSPGLPEYLTPFVGREREQAELADLLTRPDCRLVTLLGPGGVGKTRLAIETARQLAGFPDGAVFVPLASVSGPESIVPTIGISLGLTFVGAGDLSTQLAAQLRDQRMLLILDNLEHLLDATGYTESLLEDLLTHTSGTVVLATSRERLRLAGEWTLELNGLSLPQPHTRKQPEVAPALRLFAGHAERVDRAFRLSRNNEAVVATICRMVDGLPLGIELAAAWTRLLSLDEIAQELMRSLDQTHLSPRTLPVRHQSLSAVVDHSWRLLNASERSTLRQLAVFHGGFTRDAAQEAAGAHLALLASLVDKSLVRRSASGRYDLHEIIRQYAHARLQEHGEEEAAVRSRHAHFYLRLLVDREQLLKGQQQARAVTEIVAEIDNIRAAWEWASAHDPFGELMLAGETLHWLHEFCGWFREGTTLFAQAVAQVRTALLTDASPAGWRTLGRLLGSYGYLATRLGALADARQALLESQTLLSDDPVGLGRTICYQAALARWSADYGEAFQMIDRSLALVDVTGDRPVRAMTLTTASHIAFETGDDRKAERLFQLALNEWQAIGNPRGTVWCISSHSTALLHQGKYREAEQLLRKSLSMSYASGDRYGMAMTLRTLGMAALAQGDAEAAIYFLREALPALQRAGNWEYLVTLNDMGEAFWQAGAMRESRSSFSEALSLAITTHVRPELLRSIVGLAAHAIGEGFYAAALTLALYALADTASIEPMRQRATELAQRAQASLSPEQVAQCEAAVDAQAIATALAELGLPTYLL